MNSIKIAMLLGIESRARRRVAALASEAINADGQDKEAVQAGIEFERWLADGCQEALDQGRRRLA